jgi:hypothetical protein
MCFIGDLPSQVLQCSSLARFSFWEHGKRSGSHFQLLGILAHEDTWCMLSSTIFQGYSSGRMEPCPTGDHDIQLGGSGPIGSMKCGPLLIDIANR